MDVTDKENWQKVVSKIVSAEKSLDILVNNAGYTNSTKTSAFDKTFENFSLNDWNSIMNVNLTGTFLGCQAVTNQMKKQKKGAICSFLLLSHTLDIAQNNYKPAVGTKYTNADQTDTQPTTAAASNQSFLSMLCLHRKLPGK